MLKYLPGAEFWRMSKGRALEGVFAINKPTGISSAQVLRDCQKHFNPSSLFALNIIFEQDKRALESHNQRNRRREKKIQIKIGHGGTLDPLATGVLIAGVGSGTKTLSGFLECTKTYETIVLFGAATDTYDRVGKVVQRAPYAHVTRDLVEQAMGAFRGKIDQVPPLYSALKMDGKPLYEYARSGKPVPREIMKREVEVLELDLLEWLEPGSHEHRMPTEEVSRDESRVAKGVWKQSDILPGRSPVRSRTPEKKRKIEWEEQDATVKEQPPSKQGKKTASDETNLAFTPMMSGGLAGNDTPFNLVGSNSLDSTTADRGPPAARIRMTVTSGFYVRSFCHGLGAAVGSAAMMAELVRTRQGEFELGKNVLPYEELSKGENVWGPQVEDLIDEWNKEPRKERKPPPQADREVQAKEDETVIEDGEDHQKDDEEEKPTVELRGSEKGEHVQDNVDMVDSQIALPAR